MVASFSALRGIRLALGLIVRWSSHYFRVTRFRLLLVYGDLSSNFFLAFLSSERYVNEIEPIKVSLFSFTMHMFHNYLSRSLEVECKGLFICSTAVCSI